MISFIGFSALRGTMDLKSCVKISVVSNILNIALTPVLIHVFRFGISGSAISAFVCDCITALSYVNLMIDRRFIVWKKMTKLPSWEQVAPLVKGSTLQARSFALHVTNLMVARKVQSIDDSGVAPAAFALAMQTFYMGGVIIYAMGMATQTLYPSAIANSPDEYRGKFKKALIQRLLNRGFVVGLFVSLGQIILAPGILKSTPLEAVRQAAIFPIMVIIAFQAVNGLTNVGEGIIIGNGNFARASAILVVASIGYMGCLHLSPQSMGLNGVFLCLAAFALLRFVGVLFVLPSLLKDNNSDGGGSNTVMTTIDQQLEQEPHSDIAAAAASSEAAVP
jgi:Na+-driven multidrug efflux pump